MTVRIQLRRDTSSNWISINPTLAAGEVGIETDTNKFKIGNGSALWNDLDYASFLADFGTAVTSDTNFGGTADTGSSTALSRSDHSHGSPSLSFGNGIDFTNSTASVKIVAGSGLTFSSSSLTVDFGSASGKVVQGDDSRLSNARVPTSHYLTHLSDGSDPLPIASTSSTGLTILVDSVTSDSTNSAATPNSVRNSYLLASSAISQSIITTAGDLIIGSTDASPVPARLPIGNNGAVLTSNGTTATWTVPVLSITESIVPISDNGNLIVYPYSSTSLTFYHTSPPTSNWTANTTGVPTDNNIALNYTMIVPQGGTAYSISALQINGTAATIKWAGSTTAPPGNVNKTDIWTFSLLRISNSWVVLGVQSANFG